MAPELETVIVTTRDLCAYRDVTTRSQTAVPVLTETEDPGPGFPPRVPRMSYEHWKGRVQASDADPALPARASASTRVCLAVDDDACRAAADLVARRTGRQVEHLETPTAIESVVAMLLEGGLQTLAWFCPGWESQSGRASPKWIHAILNAMRRLAAPARCPVWGIVTGVDRAALTRMAAKSLLNVSILGDCVDRPSLLFNFFDPAGSDCPIPALGSEDGSLTAISAIDHRGAALGGTSRDRARQAVAEKWRLVAFKAHGRSYCAALGYLCGAREPNEERAAAPRSCVLGMQCAFPDWPQVDPGSFDTPVLLLDTCGSGHLTSRIWNDGVPSLAFKAVAGTPAAVVTSDSQTFDEMGDFVDLLWAVSSSESLGEAVRRLNEIRREPGRFSQNYFLLGDPDWSVSGGRSLGFARRAGVAHLERSNAWQIVEPGPAEIGGAPYLEIRDLPVDAATPVYLWSDDPQRRISGARLFRSENAATLWLGVSERNGSACPIYVQAGPKVALPANMIAQAGEMASRTLCWRTPLQRTSRPYLESAARVIWAGSLLQGSKAMVRVEQPHVAASAIGEAVEAWLAAHVGSLEVLVDSAHEGISPYYLWMAGDLRRSDELTTCRYCGHDISYEGRYPTYPCGSRVQTQCLDCDLVEDRPGDPDFPLIFLDVPENIPRQGQVAASLTLRGVGRTDWLGACAVVLDGKRHAITAAPKLRRVCLGAEQTLNLSFTLSRTDAPRVAHRYRVRALVVLNGLWYIGSRTVFVEA